MKRSVLVKRMFIIAILVASAWTWLKLSTTQKAPDVAFMTITGEKITMGDLLGHPALVTFWATDCPSCIEEIPHLIKLHQDYVQRGLRIIAVAMYYDMPSRVIALSKAEKLPYPVALDPQARIASAFGEIQLTPSNFLIAPDGTIAMRHTGLMDMAQVRSQIIQMLKKGKT